MDTFLLAVALEALCTFPQSGERQPVRPLRLLERWQGGVELQLARQRLEPQQPVSVPRKSLHFSLPAGGEFCLISWPFQPPSILPISSRGKDRAMYFLLSSDLVSQVIKSSIFIRSNFRTALMTYGSVSSLGKKFAVVAASINSIKILSIRLPRE